MNCLSPSLLAADFARLGQQVALIDQAGAQYVHIAEEDIQWRLRAWRGLRQPRQ